MSYEESWRKDNMVSNNNNNTCKNYNVVIDSESDENEENLFNQELEEDNEVTPKTTLNQKWWEELKICKLSTTKMQTKLQKRLSKMKQQEKI